jgi:hypothetical protein
MSAPFIVTIRPGVAFEPAAAASWRRMEKAAGRPIDVNSSYRDWNQQYILWWNYTHHIPGSPFALHPDKSMHCKGLAVDSDDQALLRALVRHGWRQTALGIDEPWHFDYFRSLDERAHEPAGGLPKPLPIPTPEPEEEEDDIMRIVFGHRKEGSDEWIIVHPTLDGGDGKQLGYLITTDPERAKAWGRMYKKGSTDYDFDVIRADYIQIQDAARQVYEASQD